eukprot:13582720-Ditylum_brightwellii.AAC.1
MTKYGPLCLYEDDGQPIDDLTWNSDTPHPPDKTDTPQPDGKTMAECLWLSSSSTGDYHENMN